MRDHPRLRDVRDLPSRPLAAPAPVLRLAYDEEHYEDAEDAIAGMRRRMREGWHVVVIRGPSTGPFAVVYQRELSREH